MPETYWQETAGDPRGWAQITREEYETISTAAWHCQTFREYLKLPMVIKAEFAFQLPLGVTVPKEWSHA